MLEGLGSLDDGQCLLKCVSVRSRLNQPAHQCSNADVTPPPDFIHLGRIERRSVFFRLFVFMTAWQQKTAMKQQSEDGLGLLGNTWRRRSRWQVRPTATCLWSLKVSDREVRPDCICLSTDSQRERMHVNHVWREPSPQPQWKWKTCVRSLPETANAKKNMSHW